jgi:WD40 repeat protein
MKQLLLICTTLLLGLSAYGQKSLLIDEQQLPNGKFIRLVSNHSPDENKRYALEFINRFTKDTLTHYIDSIEHAHCSPINSIFFINDSTGFFTESGGCYASYDWLFRTTDKGLTWKYIESGSRTFGHSALCRLNNKSFYMFNEFNGIIIWNVENGKLIYSLSSDGGLSWHSHAQNIHVKPTINEVQHFSFSTDGQVTLVFSEKYVLETDRKRVIIIQSSDFGKSFHIL